MTTDQKTQWTALENDHQRRDWMACFVIDPTDFKGKVVTTTTATNSKLDEAEDGWLTLEQLGGPLHLNDSKAAQILVDSKTLSDRPHEYSGSAFEAPT